MNSSDSIGLVAWFLSQGFCCIECLIANEEEGLIPISSQVFIHEGMSLCLKHFRIRSSSSGFIPPSTFEKVERKREQDLAVYEHWIRRIEHEGMNDDGSNQ
jgi:hypothetical protein